MLSCHGAKMNSDQCRDACICTKGASAALSGLQWNHMQHEDIASDLATASRDALAGQVVG